MIERCGLETLFDTVGRDAFLRDHWRPERLLVAHGSLDRLQAIRSLAPLRDLASVLEAYRGPITIYGKSLIDETEGLANRMIVPRSQGPARYRGGCTLEFDGAEVYVPALRDHIENLRVDLELPEGTFSKAIVYASPPHSGLGAHFDAYVNFIVQLRGCKTWYVAENQNVKAPLMHYDLDEQPFVPDELRSYWRGEAPRNYEDSATRIELRPGSVLFLPRGYWHATEATDEVLSVNITFSVPTWLDLALAEIRARLVRHEAWRGMADGAGSSDPRVLDQLRANLAGLLARWSGDVGALDADSVLKHQAAAHDVYQLAIALFRQGLSL
jgi:ribosomal protein L16 Arg81 hydroxylase